MQENKNVKKITSVNNERVKLINSLNDKKGRDKNELILIEGKHLIDEAKRSSIDFEYFLSNDEQKINEEFNSKFFYQINGEISNKISRTKSTQGIFAVIGFENLKNLHNNNVDDFLNKDNLLIVDNVNDPGNLGTILRTAEASGFKNIVISDNSVDLFNSKVIRSSQGSIFRLNVLVTKLNAFLEKLKEQEFQILGTFLNKTSKNIFEFEPRGRFALVVGNEANGISEENYNKITDNVIIPFKGETESLNLSVATGIMLFYLNNFI